MKLKNKYHFIFQVILIIMTFLLLSGCSSRQKPDKSGLPLRDNTPMVLTPESPMIDIFQCENATIDYSNCREGYIISHYEGTCDRVRMIVKTPDATEYTYMIHNGSEVFPLTGGDGKYGISLYENVEADMYAAILTGSFEVTDIDPFKPYLYPNQYADFSADDEIVSLAAQLAADCHDDLDVVEKIYTYTRDNIEYDDDKAASLAKEYLPDVDAVLKDGRGICFDYASVMVSMLRSQGIPARLEIGYTGTGEHHAWLSVYFETEGWIDDMIEVKGNCWSLFDPTMASTANRTTLESFLSKKEDNYILKYCY